MRKTFYKPNRAILVLAAVLVACQVKALKPAGSGPASAISPKSGISVSAQVSPPAGGCSFSFTLDEPCKTSAGVYTPDGTLIRTLWSKVRYPAGTSTALWDGLDDSGKAVAPGTYQIKLLQHNTEYVWDGAIGNTSADLSGPTVHHGFWPMCDMAISGTNGFYVSGYNEGSYDFRNFLTTDPQRVRMAWYWVYEAQFNKCGSVPGDVNDLNWLWAAADSNRVYFACSATPNPANLATPNAYPGCVVACNVGDNSPAYFANGVQIVNNGANSPLPSGIYVGTQPGLSGLSVQQNGNLLAVSVAPDNRVYLMDKVSGAALGSFAVSSPGRSSFSPDGSLWVISGTSVICYSNPGTSPTAVLTIPNLSKPLDVAVDPSNANLILVADGGASQQVKAFNSAGAALWVYGLTGGYQVNGVAVATNKFWFFDGENEATFLCFAPDGSFWVGDEGNHRCLHFSSTLNYIEQIMYQPHSYMACVDQNNPSRVFSQFLEFSVDYTKPLPQAWTLVNNWRVNVDPVHISWNEGLREVTTFPNGHTYALIDNNSFSPAVQELCELGPNQLRFTGIFPLIHYGWISLGPDGLARATSMGVPTWYEQTLTGFDASDNPVWNAPTLMATASAGGTDPVPRCCSFGNVRATVSTNNILVSFDQSLNNGWHLGGIRLGDSKWLWKASPAGAYLNGAGVYEISNGVTYAGSTVQALGRNIVYGYHGEFFRGQGQACQTMHYYDDGLFVGQFGEATPGHAAYEDVLPAKAANSHCRSLVETASGDYYVWINDEAAHGPQRWHFVNARNIREQMGSGALGSNITLTNQTYDFPSGVTGSSGFESGELSWQPVPGASSYNIRYSTMNGGPYSVVAGSTAGTNYVVSGLANGQTYYFAVSAIVAGTEGSPSEQVEIRPFDTSQTVLAAGDLIEGGQFTPVIEVSSNAVNLNQASWVGGEHLTGVLNLRELDYYGYGDLWNQAAIGTKGYVLYSWASGGVSIANVSPSFTVTTGTGWADIANLERQYRLDNVLGVNHGWAASPVGTIYIGVTDNAYHVLTVVSPSQFNGPRNFSLGVTSTNASSAQYTINENPGYSHVFQFLFRGNIILWANATGGSDGIVQALFLDDAAVVNGAGPTQPTGTSTSLSSSPNPALAGSVVTFSATVAGSGGVPTGTVAFYDSANSLGLATLNGSGQASLSTAALSAGGSPHSVTAVYSGDSVFASSTSSAISQIITNPVTNAPAPPPASADGLVLSYSLASNGNDSQAGNNLILVGSPAFNSAAINWNGAVPTLGYSSPQQWPQTGLTVASWIDMSDPTANYSVASCYGNVSGSVGGVYMQFFTLGGGLTARVVQNTDANYIGRSTPAILSSGWHWVAFTWSGGTNSGGIKIYVDGVEQDNADNSHGTFTGPYSGSDVPFSLGAQLSCGYGIGGKFSGSQKGVQVYNRALSGSQIAALYGNGSSAIASTTTINSSANPAWAGSALTFTATVNAPGGIPAGTVGFLDGSTSLGTGSLSSSGTASITTTGLSLSGSPHLISAVYSGNGSWAGSTSSVLSQVITAPADITNGLLLSYPLGANGNDSWGGNNLTLMGSPTFTSGAVNWNGAVPTLGYSSPQPWPQSGLTVAGWINMSDPSANYSVASCYGNVSGSIGAAYMQFFTLSGSLTARVIQNTDANYIGRTTPAVLTAGWHYVAFTWSGATNSGAIRIYVDGVQVDNADNSRGAFTGPYSGGSVPLGLGAQLSCGYGIGGKFYGNQRAVRLYSRALSASEIDALYSTGASGVATSTTISSSVNPASAGTAVTFTATISANGGIPSGTVGFFDGSLSLGAGSLNGGSASLTTSGLSLAGSPHLITAVYNGNGTFAGSTSAGLTQVVSPPADITNGLLVSYSLASNGNDSQAGNNLTLVGSPTFSSNAVNWSATVPTFGYSSPQQWPQTALSVTAWINMNNPTANYSLASSYGNVNASVKSAYMQFFTMAGGLGARVVQNTDVNYIGRSTPPVLSSGWHFAVFTWSGGTNSGSIRIYLDGTQRDNADSAGGTFKGPYSGSDVPLAVGAQLSSGYGLGGKFSGSQKAVRVYKRALSAAEIATLYGNGS